MVSNTEILALGGYEYGRDVDPAFFGHFAALYLRDKCLQKKMLRPPPIEAGGGAAAVVAWWKAIGDDARIDQEVVWKVKR